METWSRLKFLYLYAYAVENVILEYTMFMEKKTTLPPKRWIQKATSLSFELLGWVYFVT